MEKGWFKTCWLLPTMQPVFNKRQVTCARREDDFIESGWGSIEWSEWCARTVSVIGKDKVYVARDPKKKNVIAVVRKDGKNA